MNPFEFERLERAIASLGRAIVGGACAMAGARLIGFPDWLAYFCVAVTAFVLSRRYR